MLGERIRKLRKQKKLTLEALAGEKLTKGMLSLIENDKAQPSMESLAYIAERLNVEVAELLGNANASELRNVMVQAEQLINIDHEEDPNKNKKIIKLIEPFIDKVTKSYESARLLELYSYALYYEKIDGWQTLLQRAADIFDELNVSSSRTKIAVFRSSIKFVEHHYEEALDVFLKERKAVEEQHFYIDPLSLLELDYHESVLYFAVGNSEPALNVMERAITLSKEKRIFYLIDDLYRLAAVHAMDDGNKEKQNYYLMKLKKYGEFADHEPSIHFYHLINLMMLISEEKQYTKALELIEEYLGEKMVHYETWLSAEKGKALYYLGRYDEAFAVLEQVKVPEYLHHPYDLAMFYILESFKGLIQLVLGNNEAALSYAKKGVQLFETLPESAYKRFSIVTLEKIKKEF
ncbi:helix-turn-helix domain-containing protein [Sutcliffiella cohnii]